MIGIARVLIVTVHFFNLILFLIWLLFSDRIENKYIFFIYSMTDTICFITS